MDTDELRAAFAEAKALSLKLLGRTSDTIKVSRQNDDGIPMEWSREMPQKPVPLPTFAEVEVIVDEKINRHKEIWSEVLAQALAAERRRHAAGVEKLRSEHDLRISALLAEVSKGRTVEAAAERSDAEVIDLPPVLRSVRRA